jgi:2-hydroxychromene-2-carboxylate isomerase
MSATTLTDTAATSSDLKPVITTSLYNDPGCPWAYSANPAFRVLEWRYGAQLDWRLVLIGLTESAEQYVARGYTPLRSALGHMRFRRFGMPFSPSPKARVSATARACRAVVAARLLDPGSEWRVFRTLQLANFTSPILLEDEQAIAAVLDGVEGVDAHAIVSLLDDPAVTEAYEQDRAETRAAAGSPAELQGKTAQTDGPVRFTAPSILFERDGRQLVAGGWQTVDAYDVLVVNLDPTLVRRAAPDSPSPLLAEFPDGLTTQEVAQLLVRGNDAPDRALAEEKLLELVADGKAFRAPLGDDALWRAA